MKDPPYKLIYLSVVAHNSIRIVFALAELNILEILAVIVRNAYLDAPCWERIWFTAGVEFFICKCAKDVVVGSLCVLKSSG